MVGYGRQLRRCGRYRGSKWKCTNMSVEVTLLESTESRGSRKFRSIARFLWRPRVHKGSEDMAPDLVIQTSSTTILSVLYLTQGQQGPELGDFIQRYHAQTPSGRHHLAARSP